MFRSFTEYLPGCRATLSRTALVILTGVAVSTTSAVSGEPGTPPDQVTVRPGGVVRWPGVGITACTMDAREWQPMAGACWYPIDLLRPPGPIDLHRVRNQTRESFTVEIATYPYPVQRLSVAPEMTDPPADQAQRIRRESRRVAAVWTLGGPPAFELPLDPPIVPLPDARGFGARRIFNGEPRSPHGGVDLSAPTGTAVRAAAAGTVVIAASHYFSGNSVFIDHGDDLVTMYFHLDRILVAEGDRVAPGEVIGTVGATGRVTGPHLHFGARWHEARIDPMVLLPDQPAPPIPLSK